MQLGDEPTNSVETILKLQLSPALTEKITNPPIVAISDTNLVNDNEDDLFALLEHQLSGDTESKLLLVTI